MPYFSPAPYMSGQQLQLPLLCDWELLAQTLKCGMLFSNFWSRPQGKARAWGCSKLKEFVCSQRKQLQVLLCSGYGLQSQPYSRGWGELTNCLSEKIDELFSAHFQSL